MGAAFSWEDEELPALPQQCVVSMETGQVISTGTGTGGAASSAEGNAQQALRVNPPLQLVRNGVLVDSDGILSIQAKNAQVDGVVELCSPCDFLLREGSAWPTSAQGSSNSVRGSRRLQALPSPFPSATAAAIPISTSSPTTTTAASSPAMVTTLLRFDRPSERLRQQVRDSSSTTSVDGKSRRWPVVLLLRAASSSSPKTGGGADSSSQALPIDAPPDGTLLVCCEWKRGRLVVAQQIVAWGGERQQGFVLKELYGLQEAEDQRTCVVCLTAPKDTALMPCSHFCVCYECGAGLRMDPARNRCPLCRTTLQDLVRINLPPPVVVEADTAQPSEDASASSPKERAQAEGQQHHHHHQQQQQHSCQSDAASAIVSPSAVAPSSPMAPQSVEELRAARLRALEAHFLPTTASTATSSQQLEAGAAPHAEEDAALPKQTQCCPTVAAPAEDRELDPAPASTAVAAAAAAAATNASASSTSPLPSSSSSTQIPGGFSSATSAPLSSTSLPRRCMVRVSRELKLLEENREQNLAENGLDISLADPDDLRTFNIKLFTSSFPPESEIGKQLRSSGVTSVELEAWITDQFPDAPPQVRVLRPRFQVGSFFVFDHGALCMELLTRQGWMAATTLPMLALQVRTTLVSGKGNLLGDGLMGLPGSDDRQRAAVRSQLIEKSHKHWQGFDSG